MSWRFRTLLTGRLSFKLPAKFDGEPCTVTVSYSHGRGVTIRIDLDEEEGQSTLSVTPTTIQDLRDQFGV